MISAQVCCVCHSQPGVQVLGGRWFCTEHQAKATHNRMGVWRSGILGAVGVLVFVALTVAADALLKPQLAGTGLMLAGLVLALAPALLWLSVFYSLDRVEPEPVGQVARLFVLGLALAGAIGVPLTDQLFRVGDWLYRSTANTLLGSVFLLGGIETAIIYAAVRYFIYDSPEFDERTDGVIYGTAAGLGYATALNLQFILASGGAALGSAEVYVAEVALAHAAFGGLLGYFLGRAKLEHKPLWWLPAGFALTALVNGLFLLLRGRLDGSFISIGAASRLPSFTGLVLSGVLALVATAVVALLVRADIARTLAGKADAVAADAARTDQRMNSAVLAVALLMLLAGVVVWNAAVNGTTAFSKDGITGAYPAYYAPTSTPDRVWRVQDLLGTGAAFSVQVTPLADGQGPDAAILGLAGERGTDYEAYKVMSRTMTTVGGKEALVQRFAYVDAGGVSTASPKLVEGQDYIFVQDGRAIIATLQTSPDDLATVAPLFQRFVKSLSF